MRRDLITVLARRELDRLRESLKGEVRGSDRKRERSVEDEFAGEEGSSERFAIEKIAERIEAAALSLMKPNLRPVINGTGVILNTNLGRAPLPDKVGEYLSLIACSYSNLEIDLSSGKRGERGRRLSDLACLITGAEHAIAVNNNASSVMLAVAALCHGKEVIVSRGELIEIGGSFRLPDVIEAAGGILKEVGTTNRTRTSDYRKAINSKSGAILKCHRSNFAMTGFTEEASIGELSALSRDHGVPLLMDLGSGALVSLAEFGLADEPTVKLVLDEGVDAVMFSGDKLLGGPQAGIIAGRRALIESLRKHPVYRAVRADKLTIAYLEQVLSIYLSPDGTKEIPALRMAMAPIEEIRARVDGFLIRNKERLKQLALSAADSQSTLGGGTLPGQTFASRALKVEGKVRRLSAEKLAEMLRLGSPSVIGIIREDALHIDFRTVAVNEEDSLAAALVQLENGMAT